MHYRPSRSRYPWAAAVAGEESGNRKPRRRYCLRASLRARTARHGRTSPANRESALVPAFAQRRIRRADRIQPPGPLWPEISACTRVGGGSRSPPLSENCRRELARTVAHGAAGAFFLEMQNAVDIAALSQALSGDHVVMPASDEDAPSNVSSAGQADIQLLLKPDPVQPNGVWLWAAADNLRISAITAVECAETMMATRPTGKIQ